MKKTILLTLSHVLVAVLATVLTLTMVHLEVGLKPSKLDQLENQCAEIFRAVYDKPHKASQIRKFMNYYLPTTLKLLNSYDRMGAQGISGENIDATMDKVEGMMDTIVKAFEKQLDSLFGAEAMDISTDITVLETMMAREGLTEQEMKAETTENVDLGDIKLEL